MSAAGVSGVAAAGAPIVGYVCLKDSLGALIGPQAIGADGSFSFSEAQLSRLTPPFFLEAKGRVGAEGCALYSYAPGPGAANINPLTNLAIGMAAGMDPARAYAATTLSAAALQTAVRRIQASLQSLLALYGAERQDFFSGAYAADHSGLDAMFDVVRIMVTRGDRAIITDKTSNATLMNEALGDVAGKSLGAGQVAGLAGSEEDMRGIAALFDRFIAAMNRVPTGNWDLNLMVNGSLNFDGTVTDPTPFGLHNGYRRSDYLTYLINMAGAMTSVGGAIERIPFTITGKTPDGAYDVSDIWVFSNGNSTLNGSDLSAVPDRVIKVGNEWKFTGNDSFASTICVQEGATKTINEFSRASYSSFLALSVMNYGNQDIDHAIVTAQGIPDEMTMTKSAQNPAELWSGYTLGDEDIAKIDQVIINTGKVDFTFMIYTAANRLLQKTTLTMYAAPPPTDNVEERSILDQCFAYVYTINSSHAIDILEPLFSDGGIYNFSYEIPFWTLSPVIRAGCKLMCGDSAANSATFTASNALQLNGTAMASIPVSGLGWSPTTAKLIMHTMDIYRVEFYTYWPYQ